MLESSGAATLAALAVNTDFVAGASAPCAPGGNVASEQLQRWL